MQRKERYEAFVRYFTKHQPQATTELNYSSPYELLVAVILGAQCTDKRVNLVTPVLFKKYPRPEMLANASFEELFPIIKSISYPNNKTKHLIGMANLLVDKFKGRVPNDVDELQELPGVGRKTANVIASVIFNQPFMPVDTHVYRVSKRIGLVRQNSKTTLEVEKQLVKYLPKETISLAHHWLILHGRYVCIARNPKCEVCEISHICRYFEKQYSD